MARGVRWYLAAPLIALGLVGCRFFGFEEREPWRAEAEERCVAEGLVQASALLESGPELNGAGVCGMSRPFKVAGISRGFVTVEPKATLACPLVAGLDAWFSEAVQPAAVAWLGEPVVEIRQISSYSCRSMNGQPGASISEHAFGNAIDVAAFRLQSGREITVKEGWHGRPQEQGFLRQVQAAACMRFSTVLAPGANAFHSDHIHLDLARRASGRTVCEPEPPQIAVARHSASPPSRQAGPAPPRGVPAYGSGPMVIAHEPVAQPAGAASIDARVMQSLGAPPASASTPAYRPRSPDRPVPPANIPGAGRRSEPVITSSAGAPGNQSGATNELRSPQPILDARRYNSEGASVFEAAPAKPMAKQ